MSVDERLRAWRPHAPGAPLDDAVRRAVTTGRSRVRRRRLLVAAALVLVLGGAVTTAFASTREEAQRVDVIGPPTTGVGGGLFAEATGHVLLFDDGYDGITAIDLDRGLAVRQLLEGNRAGDNSPRLVRSGDSIVYGWGNAHVAPLDGSRPPVELADAYVFYPSYEPGRVWVRDQQGTIWQVDNEGNVTAAPLAGSPTEILGIPGGFVATNGDQFGIYDVDGHARDAPHLGHPIVSTADELVFYEGLGELKVLDYASDDVRVIEPGLTIEPSTARLSPNEHELAFGGVVRGVVVIDLASGDTVPVIADSITPPLQLAWAPDGTLYAATNSYMKDSTTLWRWQPGQDAEQIELPIGGLMSFLAVDATEVGFVDWDAPDDGTCPPPTIQPSGRGPSCAMTLPR